jgi:hypothetical protein
MRRFLLGTLVAVAGTAPAVAQLPAGTGSPPGMPPASGFGGGFGNRVYLGPRQPGSFRMTQAPGFRAPGFGQPYPTGVYPGYGWGGGFVAGGYAPYVVVPVPVEVPQSVPSGPAPPSTVTSVSGVLPATLVLQYPAAAKVWLDGVEVPGSPDDTWTLTSRDLRPGETATFRVRGRWASGGRTYESVREVPLGPGARSRLVVVSGTEIRE